MKRLVPILALALAAPAWAQEGAGTLLDPSVVLFGSGMKDGNGHKKQNLPIILAGRGHGFKPGRHGVFKPGTPLTSLHATLLNRFGIEADSFNGRQAALLSELF